MKKILSFLTALTLVFGAGSALPEGALKLDTDISASAETKTYGDYEYTDLDDDEYDTVSITKYNGTDTKVTIPSTIDGKKVTSIGAYAFNCCTSLASITIPNSVTSIGYGAFSWCESLESVTIPDSVTNIDGAFFNCTNLTSITIPDSVTSIGEKAFSDCISLKSITIPNSVTSIGYSAFSWCTSLKSITIPNSVTSIGYSAFGDCTSLESITIPDSVTSIDVYAFWGCKSLKSVTIPNSVTSISPYAFGYDSYTNKIDGFTIYGYSGTAAETYANDYGLEFVDLGKEYTYGDWTYKMLADGTAEIEEYKGSDTKVTIPAEIDGKKVTSIGDYTFWKCTSLTSITIPDSVTSIGEGAFGLCTSLTSITIPNSVTSIGEGAFGGCKSLKSITIPDSITSIGVSAFWNCTNLKSVTIPDSVTSIDEIAFEDCTSLKSITIPNSVTSIGDRALGYDSKENKIDGFTIYGNSGTAAETYANDNGFEFVDLGKKYTYGDWVYTLLADGTIEIAIYQGNDAIVTVPAEIDGKKVTSIGDMAFYKRTSITSLTIPDGITSIGNTAFAECLSLTSITIPDSVTSIGDSAFGGCESLKSISIPNGVTSIGKRSFFLCGNLTSVTIPDSVTSIEGDAFLDCESLKSVTIPDSVTDIGDNAFGYYYYESPYDSGTYSKYPDFTIYGYKDTAAETYANDNGFTFIPLDEIKKGDVNGDTYINMKDLTRLQQYLAEWEVDINKTAADVTGDGKLTMGDLTRLQQYLAGWKVTLG